MESEHVKAASIAGWVLAISVLGYISGTTSLAGWTVLATVALIPPAVMMSLWHVPSPSMSESIREVLR